MRSKAAPVSLVLFVFLIAPGTACLGEDAHGLTRIGSQMNSDEKASLEEQVAKNPNDIESRTKLLGYYFINGRQDPDTRSARRRHVEWLIENAPESEVLGLPYGLLDKILEHDSYDRAKQAWLKVIRESPENLTAIRNAARFFLLHDRKISEELLLKGQKLAAEDPEWPASLGRLYSLGLMSIAMGPVRNAAAKKAFQQYELAYDHSDSMGRDALVSDLAKAAFDAGLIDDAKKFAERMLEGDAAGWNRGHKIHHGNLILGRIALAEGDIDEAKSRLILAGKTDGSPQLNSFGPNMLLAKELLERGETATVLQYFELCKEFWNSPRRELDRWTDDVKANRIPQFGANLAY